VRAFPNTLVDLRAGNRMVEFPIMGLSVNLSVSKTV
jgi:hypothetical protein